MKHHKECQSGTEFRISDDKQGLACDGAKKNVCGQRLLPEKGAHGTSIFLKDLNFDPRGHDHWSCPDLPEVALSSYTFRGSYYYAYVKVATCAIPKGAYTRIVGLVPPK